MRQTINGAAFRAMMLNAAAALENEKEKINDLNVFPVPDGDTGTNMSMTLSAAAEDLRKLPEPTLAKAASVTASALLRGARGNSGVILSLLFRGFSKVFKELEEADGKAFAQALSLGVEAAYKAVMKPAEGTILTVSRLTAEAAQALAEEDPALESVLEGSLVTAKAALENTINQNPVLQRAGVVDAGGAGFTLLLESMLAALRGETVEQLAQSDPENRFCTFCDEDITFTYDTVFIVRRTGGLPLEEFRAYLSSIGDCLVIGEDDDAFKVHVHTDRPGDALNEAAKYGTLELCKIENMRLQHDDLAAGRDAKNTDALDAEETVPDQKQFGAVSVCAGAGLSEVFRDLGCDRIIEGGQTMNPSTKDILEAVNAAPAKTVFVLPNNKNIIMAAEAAAELAQKQVIVLPSKTIPQGIAAMLAFEADQGADENREAMTEAMAGVETMQITYAARDSDFDGHDIHAGDYLGLCEGALFGITQNLDEILRSMAEKAAADERTFITIFYGSDISPEQAEQALDVFQSMLPDAEVNLVSGGQPIYYYLISLE